MKTMQLTAIGTIVCDETGFSLHVDKRYLSALAELDGFSHVQALWWFDGCDTPEARAVTAVDAPYTRGPASLGVFATRSPRRPNPIALSCAGVTYIDHERGVVGLTYIDANDGSPLLDIKPYTPSLDRVESPETPAWCAHWPQSCEESGDFDWESEFNY